jgi:hypothetical protein
MPGERFDMKTNTKRTTIYLDADIHHALRIKAAETENSMSELIEEAIKTSLVEDSIDLAAFEERKNEPSLAFEDVLKRLKRSGKI